MNADRRRFARFDGFELDRHTLELRRHGELVKLQQQPARLLALLLEQPGDMVPRESLRRAIWGDETFVDFERGLNQCARQIRAALGDSAETPRYLETLRGRGYRFIGRLEGAPVAARRSPSRRRALLAAGLALVAVAAVGAWQWRGSTNRSRPAIGVPPLAAPAAEREWAVALHAQIVSRLANLSRTPVVDLARASASAAHTRWLLEGRVDRSADQYRVTMLLRDTRDGSVPWSDIFAGTPGDWVDAQSEMADRLTEIVRYRIEGPSAGLPMRRSRLPARLPASP